MKSSAITTWVELVLRRYAGQTNRLIAGRRFSVTGATAQAEALREALSAIGARLVEPGEPADAVFAAQADQLDAALSRDYRDRPRRSAAERIDNAAARMPIVAELSARLRAAGLLDGLRVGVCLVVEPKTAVLVLALAEAGAEVSLFCHPEETDAEVAAELARRGIAVFHDPALHADAQEAMVNAFLDQQLHLLIDDGSRVIRALAQRQSAQQVLIGAAEETTSGLRPLRELGEQLSFPVVAVNDAGSKRCFDNAHGTGQSCLFTILDLVDPAGRGWPIAGRRVAVAGFGPVGEGFARHARALGAEVSIADPDPLARLRARFSGYPTAELRVLAADADLIVSASGRRGTIDVEVLRAAQPGAVIAVAGGVAEEVEWEAAVREGAQLVELDPYVQRLEFAEGSVLLLDRGGCINCTAGEGNPIEIMDLSFGVQLSALQQLLSVPLPAGVHPLGDEADRLVAELALTTSFGEPGVSR